MSLAEAQRAKVDAILRRCRLEPGQRLLDVGCGWGSAAVTAATRFGARVFAITIDAEQHAYTTWARRNWPANGAVEFHRQDWESFTEPVDRIICVNAFENFDNKRKFLSHCRALLPVGGVVVVLTVTADRPMFRVISRTEMVELGRRNGFEVEVSESLAAYRFRRCWCQPEVDQVPVAGLLGPLEPLVVGRLGDVERVNQHRERSWSGR